MTNEQWYAIRAQAVSDARQGYAPSSQYSSSSVAQQHYMTNYNQTKS